MVQTFTVVTGKVIRDESMSFNEATAEAIRLKGQDKWDQILVIPTSEAVDALKQQWLEDPCWDLEESDHFGFWKNELKAFREKQEKIWQQEHEAKCNARIAKRCTELGCSPGVLKYIEALEARVEGLEDKVLTLENAVLDNWSTK